MVTIQVNTNSDVVVSFLDYICDLRRVGDLRHLVRNFCLEHSIYETCTIKEQMYWMFEKHLKDMHRPDIRTEYVLQVPVKTYRTIQRLKEEYDAL